MVINVFEVLDKFNKSVKGVSDKIASNAVVSQFRKCNRICIITKEGEMHLVDGNYRDLKDCILDCKELGFVPVKCYNEHERERFISISNVSEFTLGVLPLESNEFKGRVQNASERVGSYIENIASMFRASQQEDDSLNNSDSFR